MAMSENGQSQRLKPAVFLDRDGTINVEKEYLYRIEDFEFVPGAPEAIKQLKDAGYLVFVVTNQSGVARGYYGLEDVERLHAHLSSCLASIGAGVDAFYVCPHHPTSGEDPFKQDCSCRKPRPGMLLDAAQEFGVDLSRSWMVGDKVSDVEAGILAGVTPLFVQTGHGQGEQIHLREHEVNCYASLVEAVQFITRQDFPANRTDKTKDIP